MLNCGRCYKYLPQTGKVFYSLLSFDTVSYYNLYTPDWGNSYKLKDTMESHSHPEIIQMQVQIQELFKKVDHHDKILVTGSDDQLSLPETVRSLATLVKLYIDRKDREEEEKKKEWSRWKWVLIGFVVPLVLGFFGQLVWFYIQFVPVATSLMSQ